MRFGGVRLFKQLTEKRSVAVICGLISTIHMKLNKILALSLFVGGGFLSSATSPHLVAIEPKYSVDSKLGESGEKSEKAKEAPAKAIPFQGTVAAIDAAARTFTLSGKTKEKERVFKVGDGTEIILDNQQSNFKAITVGELVRGQAYKRADGWDAKKVMIGPKEEGPAKR